MTTLSNGWRMPARLEMLLEEGKQWQWVYRPEFFRLDREGDQVRFSHLLASGTHLLVHDQFLDQLGELIKARMPVLATYDIRRANCSFPSSIARLFTTDLLIGRGLGEYVLVIPDRNSVTLIPTVHLFQGKPQETACWVTTERHA